MYDIPFISMIIINRELPIIDIGQRHCGGEYRRSDRQEVADPKMPTSRRQDQHLIDTDKLNGVTDL
jgi:hypothetical protein